MSATIGPKLRQEKVYEKYAWIIFFVPGLILGVLSVMGLAFGYSSEAPSNILAGAVSASTPQATISLLNYVSRGNAMATLFLMILLLVVASTGYRSGKPWAWYVILWLFSSAIAAFILEVIEGQNNFAGFLILGVPFALGLFLPFRKFFPKKQVNLTS
jgi:hypothetical protein